MVYDTVGAATTSWAGRTAPEIRDLAARDGSILLLPVGSIEQHGRHLPVATDTILVDAIAELGAERVAEEVPILVAPPVWSGFSPHHLSFGGTLTADFDHIRALIEDVVETGLENEFDAVVLLNGHGGNKSLIGTLVSTIGKEHPDSQLIGLTYFDLADTFIDEIRESEPGGMAHGGEFETSLMLHLRPELVRDDQPATYMDEPYERGGGDLLDGGSISVYRPFEEYSDSGAIGDPSLASEDKGKRIYRRLGDELESVLRDVYQQNN